jgi:hypothetical protein
MSSVRSVRNYGAVHGPVNTMMYKNRCMRLAMACGWAMIMSIQLRFVYVLIMIENIEKLKVKHRTMYEYCSRLIISMSKT